MGSTEWVPDSHGSVPQGTPSAVIAGYDEDGGPLYVGRASEAGALLPAKISSSHGCAYVTYDGQEIQKDYYEVLISDDIDWTPTSGSDIPSDALMVGFTEKGDPLYVGKTEYEGTETPGKVQPSDGCLYFSWGGKELKVDDYDIMISR